MYEDLFGLREPAFNMTPDPRFMYFSGQHREAMTLLCYGVQSRCGFMQITGEIGAGKTTLCRTFLDQTQSKVHTALIFNPKMSESEMLEAIIEDFGVEPALNGKKSCFDALNRFLLREADKGMNAVVIIDEAQLLHPNVLEEIRLLSNLETATKKLIQIILVGQPELRDVLNRPELTQLRQRITIRFHLTALNRKDTFSYIQHRLNVAGSSGDYFTDEAVDRIYALSGGIPRVINTLANRAMMAAYTHHARVITPSMVELAQADLEGILV
ncbi:MAG: hypothetical protein A2Z83_00870 [Omnitrophica bacterium GWA2_52_8]|nr:MAG: hypothetical protein A2Z83_00870 [Omnitrophica bacterium GWA2_52_8]